MWLAQLGSLSFSVHFGTLTSDIYIYRHPPEPNELFEVCLAGRVYWLVSPCFCLEEFTGYYRLVLAGRVYWLVIVSPWFGWKSLLATIAFFLSVQQLSNRREETATLAQDADVCAAGS